MAEFDVGKRPNAEQATADRSQTRPPAIRSERVVMIGREVE